MYIIGETQQESVLVAVVERAGLSICVGIAGADVYSSRPIEVPEDDIPAGLILPQVMPQGIQIHIELRALSAVDAVPEDVP